MKKELIDLLSAYLDDGLSLVDSAEWLAGVSWDRPGPDLTIRTTLADLELLATDVLEGLRPEQEFREAASVVVAREAGVLRMV
ncbi:MAG: hypothetical protein O3B65_06530 [Chloroflexi bacterium]|nr:hypothetical protein [Chloroflexota bacterium]